MVTHPLVELVVTILLLNNLGRHLEVLLEGILRQTWQQSHGLVKECHLFGLVLDVLLLGQLGHALDCNRAGHCCELPQQKRDSCKHPET